MTDKRVEAFASKVLKRGHDECWEWLGGKCREGYGRFRLNGCKVQAHRYSWTLFFGEIPDGELVLHKCNNPSCVNPYHLYLGSQKDNMRDMVNAGRWSGGRPPNIHTPHTNHSRRKFRLEHVEKMQELLSEGKIQSEVAKEFGITQSAVSRLVRGERSVR